MNPLPPKRPGVIQAAAITVQVHPPERRRRPVVVAPCSCCCCCCCCLHSIGSVAGATVAGVSQTGRPGAAVYWWTVAVLFLGLGLVTGALVHGSSDMLIYLVIGLLVLPLVQAAGSIVAALVIALAPAGFVADKSASLWAVGKITLWSILGAIAGIAVMVVIGILLAMR